MLHLPQVCLVQIELTMSGCGTTIAQSKSANLEQRMHAGAPNTITITWSAHMRYIAHVISFPSQTAVSSQYTMWTLKHTPKFFLAHQ